MSAFFGNFSPTGQVCMTLLYTTLSLSTNDKIVYHLDFMFFLSTKKQYVLLQILEVKTKYKSLNT